MYLRDRQRNETRQVDLTPSGGQPNANGFGPSISDDGRFIAFLSAATDLASSPGSVQAFLLDRASGAIRRVSTDVTPAGPYDYVNDVTISGDGRKIAFTALDFLPTSTVNDADVFVADVASGSVQRVGEPTPGVSANGWVLNPSLSGDGRWVSYQSAATDLVAGDSGGKTDVFAEDLQTGAKQIVSVRGDGAQANDQSSDSQLNDDGCAIVFDSYATNLVGGGGTTTGQKTFVRDRCQGTTEAASITSAEAIELSDDDPQISGDGCFVVYTRGDSSTRSAMMRDRCLGQTTRIDISTAGELANGAVSESWVSLGGAKARYVVFSSKATNLAGSDSDAVVDVFLRDRANNTPPKAALVVTQTGNRVSVDATASADPDGFGLTGSIGFGDGTAETAGLTASHDYSRAGTYTLALSVTDSDGTTDRVYQAVTVTDPPPTTGPGGGNPPPGDNPSGRHQDAPHQRRAPLALELRRRPAWRQAGRHARRDAERHALRGRVADDELLEAHEGPARERPLQGRREEGHPLLDLQERRVVDAQACGRRGEDRVHRACRLEDPVAGHLPPDAAREGR